MDLTMRCLYPSTSISTALTTPTHLVTVHTSATAPVISASVWQPSADLNSESTPLGPHSEWHSASGHSFSTLVAVDHTSCRVYAALSDRRRVVTFPFTSFPGDAVLAEDPTRFDFQSPLTAFVRLPRHSVQQQRQQKVQHFRDEGDFVFVFSDTGECALVCVKSGTLRLLQTLSILPGGHVLDAVAFDNDFVLVFAVLAGQATLYPLFLDRGNALDSASVNQLVPMRLPAPPKGALASVGEGKLGHSVLGFDFDESSGAVLYLDGTVHVLHPETTGRKIAEDCFGLWQYAEKNGGTSSASVASVKLAHAFQVSAAMVEGSESPPPARQGRPLMGGLVRLGTSYIAVAYGHYVSIWDVRYFVGHGLIRIRGSVASLTAGRHKAAPLLCTDSGLQEVSAQDADVIAPVTLGLAMTRKGFCEEIVTRIESASDAAPIRSQPVTVSATRTAAEAGGRVERVFRSLLQAVDDAEQELVSALLNREQASTAEEVARLMAEYTTVNNSVRRGNFGEDADTGLARLPSERLAAVSVARCLHELHRGNCKFVVPLIDMLGTGVVSNEAVMAVLGLSDSWELGTENESLNLLSIIDPLLLSQVYWNALEAVVTRVSDLSEPDIVRVVQVVVRMTHGEFQGEEEAKHGGAGKQQEKDGKGATLLTRATNLLMKCVMASAARARLVESLKQIPAADAIAILRRLEQILNCRSFYELKQRTCVPKVPVSVQAGFFNGNEFGERSVGKYRGVGNWLNKDREAMATGSGSDELRGCIAWIGHLIDAHLTNLIMDEQGQRLSRRLLRLVRRRRQEYELLKSLQGVSWQISKGTPLGQLEDPLYRPRVVEVPLFASLK